MFPLKIVKYYKVPRTDIKRFAKVHIDDYYRFGEKLADNYSLTANYTVSYNKILGRTVAEDGMNFTSFMTRHKLKSYLSHKSVKTNVTLTLYPTSFDDAKRMLEESMVSSVFDLDEFFNKYYSKALV